ncbi:MAG: SIR2 family protein [Planctomycetes bacterium]|nr:SIR2 family protein [Planctomycetota bacterium]
MEKLKQVLAQKDTVLFIGSGISLWSGLPSWPGVIEELAKFVESSGGKADLVRAEAARGELLQAASYGFDKLTKQQIGDFIRATCRYGVAKPHEIHRKIVSLGTSCFVTTNYDNLLEEALRQWRPHQFFRPPITNRHLTETAEIVHARATDFVFKPHGDAGDSDSIILTREQYRQLLPQGERQHALESLKMLLASRPVVYLGFGLRDPDFIYVRDLLANTYKGGTRDHYAIMADVADAECDYWRRNYGIHLVSYPTTLRPDSKKDHTALLKRLDSLLEPAPLVPSPVVNGAADEACTPDLVLSLARHAARLARAPKVVPEFAIRVHADFAKQRTIDHYNRPDKFDHYPIGEFLDDGPDRAILVGLPGAGKTYALQQAASRLAEKLHDVCLSEPFDESSVVIPIFVDLKLYRGDLADLVNQTLPPSLPFPEMTQRFRSKIFLDSFNEMPREYWESGSYEGDFTKFTESIGSSSLIIGSRTNDGLDKFGFPAYCLDQIDDMVVTAELARFGIDIEGRFDREVRWLLQKPFYFQLIKNGDVSFSREAHPRDLYKSFFVNVDRAFGERFGKSFGLEEALSIAAYDAINRGEEAYPLSELLRAIKTTAEAAGAADTDARDIANWLVSTSVLIPHIGGRIAFVHQSVTEYLAAKELARRYQTTPQILKEKLTLTRWDQALFLALSLLPPAQAEAFFNDVARADFVLALNAVKYLEVGRDDVVSKLLTLISERNENFGANDHRIGWIIQSSLPLSDVHEPQLRALMKLGNIIGGAAVIRLVAMKGPCIKDELLREFVEARSDYNYCCNGLARALKPFAAPEDVRKLAELADSISGEVAPESDDEIAHGFTSGAAELLEDTDIAVVKQGFLPSARSAPVPEVHARVLCSIIWKQHSTAALELAGELLLRGINKAATGMYFVAGFSKAKHELSWTSFTLEHLNRLMAIADDPKDDSWAIRALKCLCSGRPDLAAVVKARAAERAGIAKASLLYCAEADAEPIFEALREFAGMSPEQRTLQPTHLLKQIDITWTGNEALFVQLLKLREPHLALAVVEQVHDERDCPLGELEIGPIEWWLDWLSNESDSSSRYWLKERLSWLFASHVSKETRHAFLLEFNKADSKYRGVLADSILLSQSELTTDDFSANAISFLLADLARTEEIDSWPGHLLGQTATEKFVSERLLPLVPEAKGLLLSNLQEVLRQAGSRHGRRYILD